MTTLSFDEQPFKDAMLSYAMTRILKFIEDRQRGKRTVKWDDHAHDKLVMLGLRGNSVLEAIPNGEIIEIHWEAAFEMVKVLIYLEIISGPIHALLLLGDDYFKIKTVYIPTEDRFRNGRCRIRE